MKNWQRSVFLAVTAFILIVAGYIAYNKGFQAGRDYIAKKDSNEPKVWRSEKWKYEITFPWYWQSLKRDDPSVMTSDVDVFCSNGKSASTAVFAHLKTNETIDKVYESVFNNINDRFGKVEALEDKDYSFGSVQYRTVLFKTQENYLHYYTFIASDKLILIVSSNCLSSEFESAKKDFDNIIDSVKFY